MPTKIDSGGGYQQGYDDGYSAGYKSGDSTHKAICGRLRFIFMNKGDKNADNS